VSVSDQPQVGDIELELGVPFPGAIVSQEHWTQPALHRLPEGPIDWVKLFERNAPRILDLGCGNGRFLIASALRHPEWDHVGIDVLPVVLRYATRRARQRGLANLKLAACDGIGFLTRHCRDHDFHEIHLYHPQPFLGTGAEARRLVDRNWIEQVLRVLAPNGKLFVQTDNAAYWNYLQQVLSMVMDVEPVLQPWPEDPQGRTRREIIATQKGLRIYRAVATPKAGFSPEALRDLLHQIPDPVFDARHDKNPKGWTRKGGSRRNRRRGDRRS
jgi:tRNA (guanine-N7-)-methyltransferase